MDVADDRGEMGMRVRKRAEHILPIETPRNPSLAIDEIGCSGLDVTHQIGKGDAWLLTNQDMGVVGHAMDCQQLLPLRRNDPGYVFLELLFPFTADKVKPPVDRKDDLNIDLGVGVCFGFVAGL